MTSNGKKILKYFKQGNLTFNKVTDNEFDELLEKAIYPLYERALKKNLLDKDNCTRGPEMLYGPTRSKNSLLDRYFRKGRKDDYVRYIPLTVTIMNFTAHELVIYKCIFDPTTETALNESTWTYFYKEIVSVETRGESRTGKHFTKKQKVLSRLPYIKPLIKGKQVHYNVSQEFIITTRGSSYYSARLSDREALSEIGDGEFKISKAEDAIRAIREALIKKNR